MAHRVRAPPGKRPEGQYTLVVPAKEPHAVLGVEPGSSPEDIKAAWRGLARRHHPDLTGDDPEAARRATRRMAEINGAYAALTRAGETIEARRRGGGRTTDAAGDGAHWAGGTNGTRQQPGTGTERRGGPPPEKVTRPITARLDLSGTVTPRNQTTTPPGARNPLMGQPPLRPDRSEPELRASQPSGPLERDISADHIPPEPPSLDEALDLELDFGKFHGHSLGEVAAFEPSYVDWLAGTVTRDPALTMAARVIRDELDRRGIRRAYRPTRPGWQSNPFR